MNIPYFLPSFDKIFNTPTLKYPILAALRYSNSAKYCSQAICPLALALNLYPHQNRLSIFYMLFHNFLLHKKKIRQLQACYKDFLLQSCA